MGRAEMNGFMKIVFSGMEGVELGTQAGDFLRMVCG
jgi:hypothetical protein